MLNFTALLSKNANLFKKNILEAIKSGCKKRDREEAGESESKGEVQRGES